MLSFESAPSSRRPSGGLGDVVGVPAHCQRLQQLALKKIEEGL
jgi:hypothetical protein